MVRRLLFWISVDDLYTQIRRLPNSPSLTGEFRTHLIVSLGFHTAHVIPVVEGAVSAEGVRRVNVGGFQMIAHLQRALQLKYTAHAGNITVSISR